MKIERNSQCPCGSGKKYKKCCWNKEPENQSTLDVDFLKTAPSEYTHVETIADRISTIIKKYEVSDIIKAIFCLNLWRRNRSALAQSLSLNLALSKTIKFGRESIKTYDDFRKLFYEISGFLKITPNEDYTVDDYGEVFINHCGKTYPIIIGTGHIQIYAAMRYMQSLASICKRDDELIILLEYIKNIINSTENTNVASNDSEIVFELPAEDFWSSVNQLFYDPLFKQQINATYQITGYQKAPIERRHFIKYGADIYPLFNSSMLVDYYKILLNNVSAEEKDRHITYTIHSLVENSYNFSPNPPNRVLINPLVINKITDERIIESGIFFVGLAKKKILVAVNKSLFENKEQIDGLIHTMNSCNDSGGLRFIEQYRRKEIRGNIGVDIEPNHEMTFMIVDSFTDISSHHLALGEYGEEFNCTPLDLIYMLGFSDDFDEIIEFIKYHKSESARIFSFGGRNNLFFTWKNSNRSIASGAIEFDFMSIDYNEAENFTYSWFKNKLYDFPRNNKYFCDPLNWKIEESDLSYNRFLHKGHYGYGGELKRISNELYVFFAKNVEFFAEADFEQNVHTAFNTMDELNQRLFLRYRDLISNITILKNKTLHILFMPWNYAQQNHSNTFLKDSTRNIVFSSEFIDEDSVIIRYSYDPERLLNSIQDSSKREAENMYLRELLLPLKKYSPDEFTVLEEKLLHDSQLNKTVGVFHIEQKYYFSDKALDTEISKISYTRARKEIAKTCLESGVEPGEYHGDDATLTIRKMQSSVVNVFEKYISSFDKFDLHKRVLNYYAVQQNGVIINMKRYLAFKDLDEEVLREFEQKTRTIREEYRRNAETAKYLLETNLVIEHTDKAPVCSKEEFEFLLAFANWLVVLQDNSDTCHHTDLDIIISIDSEYRVDTILNEEAQKKYESMLLRKYNTSDYYIKNDTIDADYFEKAMEQFSNDTSIDFKLLILILDYMQLMLVQDGIAQEIYPNVFSIDKVTLKQSFIENLEEKIDEEAISTAIDFITLNPSLLKTTESTQHDILPIWERKRRENRFEIKPIIINDDKLIFSPVSLNYLETLWISGMTEWYLPYEIGLNKLKDVLKKWKKRYEDEMVQDIAQIFRDLDFDTVEPDIEFMRRFPKDDYPTELGDYDVVAISKERKEIWIIESKVIQKVGSVYEDQMQQKSFFQQHKEDEKFQRRIDYMTKNYKKILSSFGYQDTEYKVIPYMVTNKLFLSRYKEIKFPLVTFNELKQILENIDKV